MEGPLLWIAEHVGTVLIAGLLFCVVLTALGALCVLRTLRRLRRGSGGKLAFAGALLVLVAGGVGLVNLALGLAFAGPELLEQGRLVGAPAPELQYRRVDDGAEASLADHRGKVVLVNLWATWCPPCREEMPALERLQQTYREQGLIVLQISDESREVLAQYLADSPMTTEHGYTASIPWPQIGLPTTYVIDRAGRVRELMHGARTFEQFQTAVGRYLALSG